jgi:hypothetical protein
LTASNAQGADQEGSDTAQGQDDNDIDVNDPEEIEINEKKDDQNDDEDTESEDDVGFKSGDGDEYEDDHCINSDSWTRMRLMRIWN